MSTSFSKQLKDINTTFLLAFDEYRKNYVLSKVHLNNNNYLKKLEKDVKTIKDTKGDMFELSNNIEYEINELNKEIKSGNNKIEELKKVNSELKIEMDKLLTGNNASEGQLSNIKEFSNTNLYSGLGLILLSGGLIYYSRNILKNV